MNTVIERVETKEHSGRGISGRAYVACFASALGLAAAFAESLLPAHGNSIAAPPAANADPYVLVLGALLPPALEPDAMPLRWVDPRASLRCGPDTKVRVNRQPLIAGALVPETPFELEWHAVGCHPFGADDLRVEGTVNMTVFREDWGFSAMVTPSGLRVVSAGREHVLAKRGGAWLTSTNQTLLQSIYNPTSKGNSL